MKRFTNIQLIVVLILLIAAIGVVKIYDSEAMDWGFKNAYIRIDPASLHFEKADTAKGRNTTIITSIANDWVRVKYKLPADASFEALKKDGGWYIKGEQTDSARTWFFLNSLDTVVGSMFIDKVSPYTLYEPEYEVDLFNQAGDSVKVECFARDWQLFIRSSQNRSNIFDGHTDSLFEKIYVGKARFFPKK